MARKTVETCELDVYLVDKLKLIHQLNPFHQRRWQWQAKANGPKGTYVAAWSATFEAYATYAGYATHPRSAMGGASEASDAARIEVVSILLREGWIPMNDKYFAQTYTREVESE